jgi:hypothetical protein
MLILEVVEDMARSSDLRKHSQSDTLSRKKVLLPVLFLVLLASIAGPIQRALDVHRQLDSVLVTTGTWRGHKQDLIYTVAFSDPQQPDGPLIAYRAPASDLRAAVPVVAVQRDTGSGAATQTPLFFPSPDGRYLALQTPLSSGLAANLAGASLNIFSTNGKVRKLLVPDGAAENDQPIWSANGTALYYHTGVLIRYAPDVRMNTHSQKRPIVTIGTEEIRRVDLAGHTTVLWRRPLGSSSLRLIGVDRRGELILSVARPNRPVELWRLSATSGVTNEPQRFTTLPADILPGNILGLGPDGQSVNCLRVLRWRPLQTIHVQIGFAGRVIGAVQPLFATSQFGGMFSPLARSSDGQVLAMSQVTVMRSDLAAQGIPDVPQQEKLVLVDAQLGASQSLRLPEGGQVVQTFWTAHLPAQDVQVVSPNGLQRAFALPAISEQGKDNASVFQQDEWMLEAHNGLLADAPQPSPLCSGYCPHGLTTPPHVSAAILHGVAYTESNWHQFNTPAYQVDGEAAGVPVESFDGGWGEYQQTWGMPPQCLDAGNCRSDYLKVENDQEYNIGVGAASLIDAWNATAGVISDRDSNDPYKANDWFFAVWAYNGEYGNNPNDVPSNVYAHWYPGAPFRSIYEEYVWYFAAHPQSASNHWTDNYLPSLGPSLLPPQSDFQDTSDDFVSCVFCTIPDWTSGTFDRSWVGQGTPNRTIAQAFQQTYEQEGGEKTLGLPIDEDGSGAAVHAWGQGWTQTMDGGSQKVGALMMAQKTATAFWIDGNIWARYKKDQGAQGCHGYPTANVRRYYDSSLGTDTYYIQMFQTGFIIWDSAKATVVADLCQSVS